MTTPTPDFDTVSVPGSLTSEHAEPPPPASPPTRTMPAEAIAQPWFEGLAPEDADRVSHYVESASAPATLRAYRSDWRLFEEWCAIRDHQPLPAGPLIVAAFLADLAARGLARATVGRRLAAIVFAHRMAKAPSPTLHPDAPLIELAMRGIRRADRARTLDQKRPADGDVVRDMLRAVTGETLRAHRDRALIAIGMGGAFRRSELVAIDVAHVEERGEGLVIRVPHSKADQEGAGATVGIPHGDRIPAVAIYKAWLGIAGIVHGAVFRKLTPQGRLTPKRMSDRGVAIVVKAAAAAAGYDPELFAGHSLRAGFLTEAGRQGADPFKMMEHSRHGSLETMVGYVRDHDRFRNSAARKVL